jgi:hypothetical protein
MSGDRQDHYCIIVASVYWGYYDVGGQNRLLYVHLAGDSFNGGAKSESSFSWNAQDAICLDPGNAPRKTTKFSS